MNYFLKLDSTTESIKLMHRIRLQNKIDKDLFIEISNIEAEWLTRQSNMHCKWTRSSELVHAEYAVVRSIVGIAGMPKAEDILAEDILNDNDVFDDCHLIYRIDEEDIAHDRLELVK